MQGYLLPLALAALLAAPVIWRLGIDVGESPAMSAEGNASAAASTLSLTSFASQTDRAAPAGWQPAAREADATASVGPALSEPPAAVSAAAE